MAYNNLQILNFNHNIVSLSNGNTLVITDNIKGNSINIPEPITHILQINSPGPQGPVGPSGSSGGTPGIDTVLSQNQALTANRSINISQSAFDINSPDFGSMLYITSSGYIRLGGGDDYIVDFSIGIGQMRIINGNQITMYAPVITLGYPDNPLIVNITGSLNVSEGITGSFSGDGSGSFTGSFTGSFNGLLTEYVLTTNLGDPGPSTPPYLIDLIITQGGTYIISQVDTTVLGYIYFPDPVLCLGQRITIQNRDNPDSAEIYDNGYLPRDITNSAIDRILSQTTKTFIAAERSPSGQINWLEL
jgi:hypothetical protein